METKYIHYRNSRTFDLETSRPMQVLTSGRRTKNLCFARIRMRQMNHVCKRVCQDVMVLWFAQAKYSCKKERKKDIQRCLKQKGIESVISNIEEKKGKENNRRQKKKMQRNKPREIPKKKKDKYHQKRKAHPSMPLEDIKQTASPPLISNLLDSIIDKTISITMTLLSRFGRWPCPRLETS
jgi:hypothetical protein